MDPAHRLIAVRSLRSFAQAYLNVVAPLYLLSRGVSAAGLGLLFTASFLVAALLTAPIGILADRWGRKPFLIAFTVLMVLWGLTYTVTMYVPLLLVISAVAGIGKGGGGMGAGQAGPFAPAETAWLADLVPAERRRRVFSWNGVLSTLLAAAGASLSGLPSWLKGTHLPLVGSDRLLFVMTMVLGAVSLVVLVGVPDSRPMQRTGTKSGTGEPGQPRRRRRPLGRRSSKLVIRQAMAGAMNAAGVSFINSLFVVWLHLRFHVGSGAIGPVFTASYLLSALSMWGASAIAGRIGSVRTIVLTRIGAAALMAGTALSPTFALAVVLQVLRTAATMMITPVRQAFTMGLFPSRERASAAGLTGVARRLSGAASPPVSGALFDAGYLELPFFVGAGLQLASACLYGVFFGPLDDDKHPPTAAYSAGNPHEAGGSPEGSGGHPAGDAAPDGAEAPADALFSVDPLDAETS